MYLSRTVKKSNFIFSFFATLSIILIPSFIMSAVVCSIKFVLQINSVISSLEANLSISSISVIPAASEVKGRFVLITKCIWYPRLLILSTYLARVLHPAGSPPTSRITVSSKFCTAPIILGESMGRSACWNSPSGAITVMPSSANLSLTSLLRKYGFTTSRSTKVTFSPCWENSLAKFIEYSLLPLP